jgi:glycosyltransferase involved in cell wall biosynthesis
VLEALAAGVPVAAYPVTGPKDIIGGSSAGVVDKDLRKAAMACLDLSKDDARARALEFSWTACARQFLNATYESYGVRR